MLPRLPFDSFLMLSLPFSVDVLDTPSIFKAKAQVQNVAFDFLQSVTEVPANTFHSHLHCPQAEPGLPGVPCPAYSTQV